MIKAKLIKETSVRGVWKRRWECPVCRDNPDEPECRFNLSMKRFKDVHKCRFCGTELKLEVNKGAV